MSGHEEIIDDIDLLLAIMPSRVREKLTDASDRETLIEVVLDLGRLPEARFTDREITLTDKEVTRSDIDHVLQRISQFGGDNRAGIERTLHRISAIRNRRGDVVGLTCRVGRAVFGTIDIIRDLVEGGKSILLLGKPGVGKTTLLRETARVLAEKKRVVIVDTSNEIAGDGDIPHPAIGRARRMQVPSPELQHHIMIEAVENHTPQVIVIDEIGREEEATAARTIAERGVQLVGTAHGNQLDNLMMNPTLSDLIGGIASVTLSDEEARRRGTQKSVLERKAPPTFDVVIEILERNTLNVHHDVAAGVDALLRGRALSGEKRRRTSSGEIETYEELFNPGEALQRVTKRTQRGGRERRSSRRESRERDRYDRDRHVPDRREPQENKNGARPSAVSTSQAASVPATPVVATPPALRPMKIYPYGVSQNRLKQAASALKLPVVVVSELNQAEILLTLRSYYRKRPQVILDAERRGTAVHVLRSNTVSQMEDALGNIFGVGAALDPFELALRETQEAIDEIRRGAANSVELIPRDAYIRRHQHDMARSADLLSRSKGKEPQRRVRIYANNILVAR